MTQIGHPVTDHAIRIPGTDQMRVRLSWASATDIGRRRAVNEDSLIAQSPIFAVADGMGGHASGDLASDAVVNRLAEVAVGDYLTVDDILLALTRATEDIDRVGGGEALGVGTTATGAALVLESGVPNFVVFNVGDSRVYHLRDAVLTQVTIDHSVVQEMVDAGILNAADAEAHPDSNVITRAIGFGVAPSPDLWLVPAASGTRLLICSDGLTREVSFERLRLHLAAGLAPQETVDALVEAALAAGGRDNISAVIVDVLEGPDEGDLDSTLPRRPEH